MIKYFAVSLLLLCMSAFAQTDTMKNDNMISDKMGKEMSMTGCLQAKDGKYWLVDKKHPNGVELMTSEDLSAHNGHKVKISGMMENNGFMDKGNMSQGEAKSNDQMSMSSLKVDKVKMLSDHCDDMTMKK